MFIGRASLVVASEPIAGKLLSVNFYPRGWNVFWRYVFLGARRTWRRVGRRIGRRIRRRVGDRVGGGIILKRRQRKL